MAHPQFPLYLHSERGHTCRASIAFAVEGLEEQGVNCSQISIGSADFSIIVVGTSGRMDQDWGHFGWSTSWLATRDIHRPWRFFVQTGSFFLFHFALNPSCTLWLRVPRKEGAHDTIWWQNFGRVQLAPQIAPVAETGAPLCSSADRSWLHTAG